MNEHLDEATFRATHEPHGALAERVLPVTLAGGARYLEIRCNADHKSITKIIPGGEAMKKVDATQPPLVELTDEEKAQLPGKMAAAWKEYEDMKAAHKKVARDHAKDRKAVEAKLASYASQIANQGR